MHNSFHNFVLKLTSILEATLCTFGPDVIAWAACCTLWLIGVSVTQDCYHRSLVHAFLLHFIRYYDTFTVILYVDNN
jgi:hypothetical protein